jgi:hypothetical protein
MSLIIIDNDDILLKWRKVEKGTTTDSYTDLNPAIAFKIS